MRLFVAPSRSSKRYPLTRANGCAWQKCSAYRLGSDGSDCCGSSARTKRRVSGDPESRTVFVTAFSFYSTQFIMSVSESQLFSLQRMMYFCLRFCAISQKRLFPLIFVDKTRLLWFNECNRITNKDIDGKLALIRSSREPADGGSRYERFWRSDSRVESVKAKASNGFRLPPLQG